jgi:hypothetical protein
VDIPEPEPEQEWNAPNPPAPKRKHQDTRWQSPLHPVPPQEDDNDTNLRFMPHLEMSVDEDGHIDYEQFEHQEELMRYFDYISNYSAEAFPLIKIKNIPTREVFDSIKAQLDNLYDGILLVHEESFPSTQVRFKMTDGRPIAVVNSALIVTNLRDRNSSRNVSSSSNTQIGRRIIHRSSDQM